MSQETPDFMRAEIIKLIENPTKNYLKFCKSVRKDIETKSFDTLCSRLKCFNELWGEENFRKIATTKIEEFVKRGMVDKLLWEIFENLKSQPESPPISSAMMAQIHTLWNIFEDATNSAKEQICVYLPSLVKDVIGNEKRAHQLRIEATKLINNLLEQNSVNLLGLTEEIKGQRTFHDNMGALIINASDYELQAQLLELAFRLVPPSERTECAYFWFDSEDLQNIFLNIEDSSFEPGCRKLLNKINEDTKGVFSILCQMMLFGSEKVPLAKDADTGYHWLDFNIGSKTLKFFFEEKFEETPSQSEDDDVWWRTVVIAHDNVADCSLFEQKDSALLKITLKENFTKLIPWSSDDVHDIQIKFISGDSDINKLRDVLESFSWIRPEFYSPPKSSVAIFSVHLADRQQGQMEVVETMDSQTPEAFIVEDGIEDEVLVNNSYIGKDMEESKELLPSKDKPQEQPKNIQTVSAESQDHVVEKTEDLEVHSTDSQEIKADHDSPDVNDNGGQISMMSADVKAAEDNHLEQNQHVIDEVDKGGNISPVGQHKDLIKAKDVTENKHDEKKIENQNQTQRPPDKSKETSITPETKSRASDESESGTESGASRRFSKRAPGGNTSNKRKKSSLPVEIIKSDRRKSSSSSGKISTDSENERKSPERKKQKTYPSAFNVAKRMEARKNNNPAGRSQDIKKKVFGRRGSLFGQKESLHIMAPARCADHFKRNKSENRPSSKKQPSQNKDTRTKEPSGEQSEHTTQDDDEKEVIQDSMPLDDSPEPVPSRRRSEVPKDSLTKVSDERLTQSESLKRTSHRIQFVNDKAIPTRLGTILRKGDRKKRDSLLEESTRLGSSASSTSSTSDTDWPGADVEPGPKLKHSLVLCKSVRESKSAYLRGRKKRASVSPGLSAISEEKSPIDIPHDEETRQATPTQAQDKPAKSTDKHTKNRGGQIDGFEDTEKELESGHTSEDTLVYETTSNRKIKRNAKASGESRSSRKKEENNKQANKPKEKHRKKDFEPEFDFDLPDLTILAAEDTLAGNENAQQESAALPNRSVSWKGQKARDKSAADKKGLSLDENDEELSTQDYTTMESRHKRKDTSHGEISDWDSRLEEDNVDDHYLENSNAKNKLKDNVKPKESRNKKDHTKQRRPTMTKRWYSEDELDEDSDFPKEHKSPKRRKTYAKKQKQEYSSILREDENWIRDKEGENKKRTTDVPRLGWQLSSKKGPTESPAQESLSRSTNRSHEEFHSRYENDEQYLDAPEYDHGYTEPYQKKETIRSRASKLAQEQSEEQSKVLGKPKERVEEMEEDEDEVVKLRRFCQDITAAKSSTPASELPMRKRRDEETDDRTSAKKSKDSKVQGKSDEQMSDHSGKTPSKYSENVENFADCSEPRSKTTTIERPGPRHGNMSKYKTPNSNPSRLDDSGLGRSIGTGSRRRTLVTSSKGSTKGRRKGELRVTTSVSKTPVTPRTSAIMRRIDEEEDFGHTKKPKQMFSDWTSSGPSRIVSTPYQEPYSPETNNDDHHQDREQKRAHERFKGKGEHNTNIRPRQLFRQVVHEHSPEEELDDDILYDKSSSSEETRDISNFLSSLGEDLTEKLRRKRQNLQRFCKRTMDVTIETINRHFEQNLSNRDEMIDSFNDKLLEEIKTLKDEMDKSKKTEEQILGRIEEDIKLLKTRRILQENKIKSLRNLCVEFQSEMIKGSGNQSDHQDAFQDEIRQELVQVQGHFLLEAQRQDRENLRRSLRSVIDASTL